MTDYTKQLVEQRRELHQWPEEGWTEFWTTNYIVNKLRSWGYEVLLGTKIINPEQVFGRNEKLVQEGIKNALARGVSQSYIDETEGYTGCVALLDTGKEGPTTAFRFDIDCVCVNETDNPEHKPNKEGFNEMAIALARRAGITPDIMTDEEICYEANRFEMRGGGLSGRTAQQFANYLLTIK